MAISLKQLPPEPGTGCRVPPIFSGMAKNSYSQLIQKEPVVLPENLVYIGVRSYEEGEAELLERLKVKIYFMDEVKERGLRDGRKGSD